MSKLFILHGWTYQSETWKPLLALLSAQGIDYEFLLIPGLTDATNPPPTGGWTLYDYVRWLEEKTANYEKVILYGHSNGGRISLAFAAKHPEKVERLILEDSAGMPPTGSRKWKRDIFKKISQAGHLLTHSEFMRNLFYKIIRVSDYRDATPEMKKTMANLLSVDLSLVLGKIQIPTLIIWGKNDEMTPLREGERIHQGIHGSRMVIIPDARHAPHVTHTQTVADLILNELKHV